MNGWISQDPRVTTRFTGSYNTSYDVVMYYDCNYYQTDNKFYPRWQFDTGRTIRNVGASHVTNRSGFFAMVSLSATLRIYINYGGNPVAYDTNGTNIGATV